MREQINFWEHKQVDKAPPEEAQDTGNSSSSGYQQQGTTRPPPENWGPPPNHPPPEGTPKVPLPKVPPQHRYWVTPTQEPEAHTHKDATSTLYPKQTEPSKPKSQDPEFRAVMRQLGADIPLERPWNEEVPPMTPTEPAQPEPEQQEEDVAMEPTPALPTPRAYLNALVREIFSEPTRQEPPQHSQVWSQDPPIGQEVGSGPRATPPIGHSPQAAEAPAPQQEQAAPQIEQQEQAATQIELPQAQHAPQAYQPLQAQQAPHAPQPEQPTPAVVETQQAPPTQPTQQASPAQQPPQEAQQEQPTQQPPTTSPTQPTQIVIDDADMPQVAQAEPQAEPEAAAAAQHAPQYQMQLFTDGIEMSQELQRRLDEMNTAMQDQEHRLTRQLQHAEEDLIALQLRTREVTEWIVAEQRQYANQKVTVSGWKDMEGEGWDVSELFRDWWPNQEAEFSGIRISPAQPSRF